MKLVGIFLLKCLIFMDKLVFFSTKFIFVWMLNSKLLYTEKDCVVLYHLMVCSIDIVTIIFTHLRRSRNLKLFAGTFSFLYVSGFALLTATLRYVHLKYYIFPVAYFALIVGFAGTKCLLTDLLRLQIPDPAYSSFCFSIGFLLLCSYLIIGATWPYVLDLVPAFEQPDSYYVSFAGITAFTFLMFLIFNINMFRNVYAFSGIRRENNFKLMLAVLFAPLYYIPRWLFLQCIGLMPKKKRHRSTLQVNPYFKFALYGFSSSVVNKMVRIWKMVYLMAPIGFYWAVTEQQHARLVFTTYHTDRRFHIQDREFYLHPTQIQLLNPLSHLVFLPLLCLLIYPAISPWAKRDRIYAVGGMMSFALYLSATIAYRQTKGNTQPLTNRPRRIVTNVVSGLEVNTSLFAKYDIQFGIETKKIDPFSGSSIYAPITNPEVYVNFTMDDESPLEDFSVMTENRQEEYVQTVFFRRKHLWGKQYLEIFNYMHHYIRPYDFMPTFRVYFANLTPLHEVSLLTPLGQRWMSIPMDSTPDVEYHIAPGLYRYTINNFASPDPSINAEYGAYYDAVVYTDGEQHRFVFTTKMGRVQMHGSDMFFVYMLLIVPEVIYWLQALRLFLGQSKQPEILQTIVMWWYFTMAFGNFLVFCVNELGFKWYQFDDYQFLFGSLLQLSRFSYPILSFWYRPLPGTD